MSKEPQAKDVAPKEPPKISMVAIVGAVGALIGGAITAAVTGTYNFQLQEARQKFEIDKAKQDQQFKILERATENASREDAAKNLLFFVDIGYLDDPTGKIKEYAKKGDGPVLSSTPVSGRELISERLAAIQSETASAVPVKACDDAYVVKSGILFKVGDDRPVTTLDTVGNGGTKLTALNLALIHDTEATNLDGVAKFLTRPDSAVSEHIVVDRSGEVVQLVPVDLRANHAGQSTYTLKSGQTINNLNGYSVGIGLINESMTTNSDDHIYTPEQITAVTHILTAIRCAYPSLENVVGHRDVTLPQGRRTDPGKNFPMDEIRQAVFAQ